MTVSFDAREGLIIVPAELSGPTGQVALRLALDTGATSTVVSGALLLAVGCDPARSTDRLQVTTGSGVEFVPRVIVPKLDTLERAVADFPVLALTLPPSAGVDGLLGLDFLRGSVLKIDFSAGEVALT